MPQMARELTEAHGEAADATRGGAEAASQGPGVQALLRQAGTKAITIERLHLLLVQHPDESQAMMQLLARVTGVAFPAVSNALAGYRQGNKINATIILDPARGSAQLPMSAWIDAIASARRNEAQPVMLDTHSRNADAPFAMASGPTCRIETSGATSGAQLDRLLFYKDLPNELLSQVDALRKQPGFQNVMVEFVAMHEATHCDQRGIPKPLHEAHADASSAYLLLGMAYQSGDKERIAAVRAALTALQARRGLVIGRGGDHDAGHAAITAALAESPEFFAASDRFAWLQRADAVTLGSAKH